VIGFHVFALFVIATTGNLLHAAAWLLLGG
jgi:hypothetical protein